MPKYAQKHGATGVLSKLTDGSDSGQPDVTGHRFIKSEELSEEELTSALEQKLVTERRKAMAWGFHQLVDMLDQVGKVNPHQHLTGSVGNPDLLRTVIQVYRQDATAQGSFLDYVVDRQMVNRKEMSSFWDQPENILLQWFKRHIPLPCAPKDFQEADDRLNLTRFAFQSGHPAAYPMLKEAYRVAALENVAHGVNEIWFRTCLGDHNNGSFGPAALAALEGAKLAESASVLPLRVRFMVGMRKFTPKVNNGREIQPLSDARGEDLVSKLGDIRLTMPDARSLINGVDSVGTDSDWQPSWQAKARADASHGGMHIAVHFGESWHLGELPLVLERLVDLCERGTLDHLDNANALFAVRDPNNLKQQYSVSEWSHIENLQRHVFGQLISRQIALGINPTSNELLTRSLRHQEGWRFRLFDDPICSSGSDSRKTTLSDLAFKGHMSSKSLVLVVGNDNSRLYPSRVKGGFLSVSEEIANLWSAPGSIGASHYGKLPTRAIARLILNGFRVAHRASERSQCYRQDYLDETKVVPLVGQYSLPDMTGLVA